MRRTICFPLLAALCFVVLSCAKTDDDGPTDGLAGTRWQVTLTDENPASNPTSMGGSVEVLYHPWLECDKDDTFTFKDGRLSIDQGANVCEGGGNLIATLAGQPFTYDKEAKRLTVGAGESSVSLEVYELNGSRLKVGVPIASGTGYNFLLFLFKKK